MNKCIKTIISRQASQFLEILRLTQMTKAKLG